MAKRLIPNTAKKGVQIWAVTNDYAYGQNASLANGSSSGAYVIDSCEVAPVAPAEIPSEKFVGGGGVNLATLYTNETEYENFTLRLSDQDDTLNSWLAGLTVNTTTNSKWRIGTEVVKAESLFTVGVMISYQMTPRGGGTLRYHHIVFPKCTAMVLPAADGKKRMSDLLIAPMPATKAPTGETLAALAGISDGHNYTIDSDNPLHIVTFLADGVATTFNTVYQPAETTVTVNASENHMTLNGTPTALSSIVVSSGLATLSAAGSAGDVIVLMHGHDNFKAVS